MFKIAALALMLGFYCFADTSVSSLNNVDSHIRSSFERETVPNNVFAPRSAALVSGVYKQSIDHFGQLAGQTFGQRYWVDSEYASQPGTAPVIFHICGESDVDQAYFLQDNAIQWAKTLGAHLVYLKHRYYGKSLPFPDFSAEHMQYLTLDNVIEDFASFEKWISASQGWKGKWVSVGGYYSGTLSAIYRLKHPELVKGALASSAPMISGEGQLGGTQSDVESLSYTDPSRDTSMRQWTYQSCINFGFWEAISSTLYEPSSWLCQQLFANAPLADKTSYNQQYYYPFISSSAGAPSNILFTYGTEDIWTRIGLTKEQNKNPNITIQLITGAGHHYNLNYPSSSDGSEVEAARAAFATLAAGWLSN